MFCSKNVISRKRTSKKEIKPKQWKMWNKSDTIVDRLHLPVIASPSPSQQDECSFGDEGITMFKVKPAKGQHIN
jgi:hypothetical protein